MPSQHANLWAVIPAGGSGTRLWPLSRAAVPKFLHRLSPDGSTLLRATMDRLSLLASPDRTLVITGSSHAAAVARQCHELPADNILIEPTPRDSCAAIGLAAAVIMRRDPDAVMGCFAADHVVTDLDGFTRVMRHAIDQANAGRLVTVGITPTHPETGYGYLRCGPSEGAGDTCQVLEFTEKPTLATADRYLESGGYLWNAGMFVWRVSIFLEILARLQPEMHAALSRIADAWVSDERAQVLADVWPTLPKISVDYAVMEHAARRDAVVTVPADFGWNDVGDFDTLGTIWPSGEDKNVILASDPTAAATVLHDSTGVVAVARSGRLIATLGIRDVVIVDTPDVVLVCPRDRAQDVKKLVDLLGARGDAGRL